jgi:hypothetical protein
MLRLFYLSISALLLTSVVACGDGGESSQATTAPPARPDGQFTMCVQALGEAEDYQAEAIQRLGDALTEVRLDSRWESYFPSAEDPVLDAGCPQQPAVPATNFVEEPGYYLVFAFVVERVPFNPLFAQESIRTETGAGVEETAGMFVTPLDLCDQAKLVQMLKTALKFDHTLNPTPTPGEETALPSATPCLGGS